MMLLHAYLQIFLNTLKRQFYMGDPSGYKDLKNEETNIGINTA